MSELSTEQRLLLVKHVNALMQPDFDALMFALDVPNHVIPSGQAAQGNRASALLQWVKSPNGCGLIEFLKTLDAIAPVPFDVSLDDPTPPETPNEDFRERLPYGVPFPRVRLPDNYVERPEALTAVKEKLLKETDQTLVVSAISGLGGLGKSVLATALVMDEEVQARFEDGILWVTLGQKPDLQTMLGEWIRELDKSREAFSANTLETASRYLNNLLLAKRMLLVVDDVWNAAHADWFRVGGAGCRVLVTTREAQLEGAEYYPLDLMSESQAIDLVRRKLEQQWSEDQTAEVKVFANSVGYLPLALDLATNQVRDGFSWAELQAEFESEREAVALEVLDASEAWEQLSEGEQRNYSLRACF
ncbi:MAG: NB-ARC domain-containing protein, partial [Cyanobacteria bacterium J06627_8]